MALKKREKASIVGICIAALILLAGYGAHQIYQEKLAEQAQQQKEELKK